MRQLAFQKIMLMLTITLVAVDLTHGDIVAIDGEGQFSGGQSSQALVDAGVDRVTVEGSINTMELVLVDSGILGGGALQFHQYTAIAPFNVDIYGNPLQYGNSTTRIANLVAESLSLTISKSNSIYSLRAAFDAPVFSSFVSDLSDVIARDLIVGADDFAFNGTDDTTIEGFVNNLNGGTWNIEGADLSLDFDDLQGGHNSNVRIIPGGEFSVVASSVPEPSSCCIVFSLAVFSCCRRRLFRAA